MIFIEVPIIVQIAGLYIPKDAYQTLVTQLFMVKSLALEKTLQYIQVTLTYNNPSSIQDMKLDYCE